MSDLDLPRFKYLPKFTSPDMKTGFRFIRIAREKDLNFEYIVLDDCVEFRVRVYNITRIPFVVADIYTAITQAFQEILE